MSEERSDLNLSAQTFGKIAKSSAVYVDKTGHLADLVGGPARVWFLSRPRRFGKSLTVSTLKALFSGRRELFEGLAVERRLDDKAFAPRPVVRLDMSDVTTSRGAAGFEKSLDRRISELAKGLGFKLPRGASSGDVVSSLIPALSAESDNGVAALIDEFDTPLVEFLDEPDELGRVRKATGGFYERLKAVDGHISFLFATGVCRAPSLGFFSAFDSAADVSRHPGFGAALGFTQDELEANFCRHIDETARSLGVTRTGLLARMEAKYRGFRFDGRTRVYNPHSIGLFFFNKRFGDFWFDSGSSERLADYMRSRRLTVAQFQGLPVPDDFVANPPEPDLDLPESFLYQAGYLTARLREDGGGHVLDYPNREVRGATSALLMGGYFGDKIEAGLAGDPLRRALAEAAPDKVAEEFRRAIAVLPHDDFDQAAREKILAGRPGLDFHEWLFRSSLAGLVWGADVDAAAELRGDPGRADLAFSCQDHDRVVGLKVFQEGEDADKSAREAMDRIAERGRVEGPRNPILLGLALDKANMRLAAWKSRIGSAPSGGGAAKPKLAAGRKIQAEPKDDA